MMHSSRYRGSLVLLLGLLWLPLGALSQKYKAEDAVPAGAQGSVLPVNGVVLEIKGLSSGVAGRVDPVQAALRDLGAKVLDQEIRIELAADVLFDFDKADLRPEAGPALEKVAAVLKAYPNTTAAIEGHTDSKGDERYNQKLSERRADSVKRWLVAAKTTTRMTTRGWGKTKPVAQNAKPDGTDDPEGRQKNRRVEIVIKK